MRYNIIFFWWTDKYCLNNIRIISSAIQIMKEFSKKLFFEENEE